MTTKRNLKNDIEELSATGDDADHQLRQEIPLRGLAEWERLTGHDMSHAFALEERQQ